MLDAAEIASLKCLRLINDTIEGILWIYYTHPASYYHPPLTVHDSCLGFCIICPSSHTKLCCIQSKICPVLRRTSDCHLCQRVKSVFFFFLGETKYFNFEFLSTESWQTFLAKGLRQIRNSRLSVPDQKVGSSEPNFLTSWDMQRKAFYYCDK